MAEERPITEEVVVESLHRILPTVDIDTATQRSITDAVQAELGAAPGQVTPFKPRIKREIDAFLLAHVDAAEQAEEDQEEEEEEEEHPAKKQKQALYDGPVPVGEFGFELSSKRFARTRVYNSRPLVDIREFYGKDGELAPGSKGLSMTQDQWRALVAGMQALNEAAGRREEGFFIELGSDKRATISDFKGKLMIGMREYYEKDGKKNPGKKGISLPPDQWAKLCVVHEELTAQMEGHAGAAPPSKTPKAAALPAAGGEASGSGQQQQQQQLQGAASGPITLSSSRKAEVSTFKGTVYCNIREYYDKDGEQKPGKKGISLAKDQFVKLREHAEDLTGALEAKNTEYALLLSSKRKATISCFKGKYYVDIREYYEQNGELKPGSKGIALPDDQWRALTGGLDALAAAMDAA